MPWQRIYKLHYDPKRIRPLCACKYAGHPRGCPNLGKKLSCPPSAPLMCETLDLDDELWIVYNPYNIAAHADKMRAKYPNWTERQVYCVLYWQPAARKQLRGVIADFLKEHSGLHVVTTPEAQGVNLTGTMKDVGIELEWPPRTISYQIAVAGQSLENFSG